MTCDQCEMLGINGVACHETGCPNMGARWDGDDWVAQRECFECGSTVDRDDPCCLATDDFYLECHGYDLDGNPVADPFAPAEEG